MAISLRLASRPTDEEILDLSRHNPGLRIEQSPGGELIVTPTGAEAGRVELEVGAQLHRWTALTGNGIAFGASAGFRLADGSLRSPDASWVRRDRWEALPPSQREGFATLCPDAVFEIRSRSDALQDLRRKMRGYVAAGAQIAVLVDPRRRAIEVYVSGQQPRTVTEARSISLDPVLPGFVLDLASIFD